MKRKVLIVLINKYSFESSINFLEGIENTFDYGYGVFYVNNGGFLEINNEVRFGNFSCVKEYDYFPETLNESVVLNKIWSKISKHRFEYIYFVFDDFDKTLSFLPMLYSMVNLSVANAVGIKGGSVFSAFFHNISFFQKNTNTEWLDFNGMLIPLSLFSKSRINLRYYRDFYQVDFGYNLKKRGVKMLKLRPFIFGETRGMRNYFRMRNPFLFLVFYSGFSKYLLGVIYFIVQLPFVLIRIPSDKFYASGLLDGIKLIFSRTPEVHHHR